MPRRKQDRFIGVKQVAELLGLAPKTILAGKCGTDELLRVKIGKRIVFSKNDVEAWIKRRIESARAAKRERARKKQQSNVTPLKRPVKKDEVRDIADHHRTK